jgi:hypothetical protein
VATVSRLDAPSLTRRRALTLGAAAGMSSLIARAVPTAWARGAAAPRSFGLAVTPGDFDARGRTGVLRPTARFDLLGARGEGRAGLGLEVRVRPRGGPWSPWVPLGAGHHHRPDTGTGAHASDPVWAGGADELQLRAARRPRAGLQLHLIAVPAATKRRGARASAAVAQAHAAQAGAQPAIITRSVWGGDAVKPRSAPSYGDVQVAFVHHTVSANDYGPQDSAGIVLAMAKYHRDTNGWNDLGYNFVVDKHGQIFEGRAGGIDQAVIGAQAQGYNSHSTGIANIGTFTDAGQSDVALDALARLIAWKLPLHGAPVSGQIVLTSGGGSLNRYKSGTPVTLDRISGHRDGDATECPGTALYAQLPALRTRAAAIAPAVPVGVVGLTMDPPGATSIVYGEALALTGVLKRGDGSPIAGQRVLVQKQGKSGWVTVARTQSGDDGAWTAAVPWRAAGRVRARAAVTGTTAAATEGVQVGCTPALAAKARTTRIKAGRSLTVSGTVRPLAPVLVTVEKQGSDGKWRKVATTTIRPRRAQFTAAVALKRPGLYRLTPRTGSGAAKASAAALYVRAVRKASSVTGGSVA